MEDQANFTAEATATTTTKPKRKRVGTYTAKIAFVLHFENDDGPQEVVNMRKKIQDFAESLGAKDVTGSGVHGSTMVDAPQ